jgi:hypothetical protein
MTIRKWLQYFSWVSGGKRPGLKDQRNGIAFYKIAAFLVDNEFYWLSKGRMSNNDAFFALKFNIRTDFNQFLIFLAVSHFR